MRRYSEDVKNFIAKNVKGKTTKALAELVNAKYATGFTEASMKSYKANYRLRSETPGGFPVGFSKRYPPEVQTFINDNVTGRTTKELTEYINSTFETEYLPNQIRAYKKNHKLSSGLDFRFPTGHVPPNKGVLGVHVSPETEFRKGHRPVNQLPVGSEQTKSDGYVWVKTGEPNRWKQKHRILWEEVHGKVPRGCCLLFSDGDRRNTSIGNLILISRSQLSVLNKLDLIQANRDLTEVGIKIADIHIKMHQRKNPNIKKSSQQI